MPRGYPSVTVKASIPQLIRLHLHRQGLYHPSDLSTPDDALALLRRLGCVQLDTMTAVSRSQNLIFRSRMRHFDENWLFDFYDQHLIFEHYLHALSILPMDEHPYMQPFLRDYRSRLKKKQSPEQDQLNQDVFHLLQQHAPLTPKQASDLLGRTHTQTGTWELNPVRRTLDILWRSMCAGVTRDRNFHKLYHRTPDQVPEHLLNAKRIPDRETYTRYIQIALDNIGIATDKEIADYFRFPLAAVRFYLNKLLEQDLIRPVEVSAAPEPHYILTRHLDLLHSPELAEAPTHSTLLSPFDPLIWFRPRTKKLFGIDFRLESYVPEAKRTFGYFAMPILLRGDLIGTLDMKHQRKTKTLELHKLVFFHPHTEPTHTPDLLPLLEDLLHFLHATDIRPTEPFLHNHHPLTKLL